MDKQIVICSYNEILLSKKLKKNELSVYTSSRKISEALG